MIKDVNILSYHAPLVKILLMLLQLVRLSRSGTKSEKYMMNFLLVGADTQKQEIHRLYDLVLALKGEHHKRLSPVIKCVRF
jgi:hypothetical protein